MGHYTQTTDSHTTAKKTYFTAKQTYLIHSGRQMLMALDADKKQKRLHEEQGEMEETEIRRPTLTRIVLRQTEYVFC